MTSSLHNRIIRPLIRGFFRGVYHLAAHVEIHNRENIPQQGPYLVTFNHISIYDPALVLSFWPTAMETLGAEYLWKAVGIGWVVRAYGTIPVSEGFFDRKLLKSAIDILQTGRNLAIAPEGRRSFKPGLQAGMPGIAYLAAKVNVPIIPVGVTGTTTDLIARSVKLQRPKVTMRIGSAYELPRSSAIGRDRKKFRQQNADTVMVKIAELLPPEYRGVYADRVTNEKAAHY